MGFRVLAGPLQGFTEAAWRAGHRRVYGEGVDVYCAPFLRVEHGEPRARDLRDVRSELNGGLRLLPQVIFGSVGEFRMLVEALRGFGAIDLNLGCPFPPQVKRARGAGAILRPELLGEVGEVIAEMPEVRFSVKMRLGVDAADQWRGAIDAINAMRLDHVTIHPRIARDQYSGPLRPEALEEFRRECRHPLILNGEVRTPEQIAEAERRGYAGVMIGRGLLERPSLVSEWREGREWMDAERVEKLLELHAFVFKHYRERLCGDAQLLAKVKPFWEYAEPAIGRKAWKAIRKSTSLPAYQAAIQTIP